MASVPPRQPSYIIGPASYIIAPGDPFPLAVATTSSPISNSISIAEGELVYGKELTQEKTLNALQDTLIAQMAAYQEEAAKQKHIILTGSGQAVIDAQAAYNAANANITKTNAAMKANILTLESLASTLLSYQQTHTAKEIKAATTTSSKSSVNPGGTPPPGSGGKPTPPKYKYNIPMVSSAYFHGGVQQFPGADVVSTGGSNPRGIRTGNEIIVDPGAYADAAKAWKNGQGGRGTIQMDRTYSTKDIAAQYKSAGNNVPTDLNLYGFKFMYNPTSVTMNWGVSAEVNPTYESLGLDAASPMALGLISSTIGFTLYLNRIEDFKYITEDGHFTTDTVTNTGITGVDNANSVINGQVGSPYGMYPDPEELAEIYKKGTMYDLEYLFRVVMGFNADFKSTLNGTTADRGWISNIAVELHLGDGLRYRVRISNLTVTHIMFNSRMVPIWSQVDLQCTRYYDTPTTTADQKAIASNSSATTFGG